MAASPALTVLAGPEAELSALLAGSALEMIGLPVLAGPNGPEPAGGTPVELVGSIDLAFARRSGFSGAPGEVLAQPVREGPTLVLLGCGPGGEVGRPELRQAAAGLARAALRGAEALFVLPAELAARPGPLLAAQAVAEGAVLGAYRFVAHRSEDAEDVRLARLQVVGTGGLGAGAVEEGVRRGSRIGRAVVLARDLVNEPPSLLSPLRLAERASAELVGPGLNLEVWDEQRIADERLGGLLAVARGSDEPARLLLGRYEPADPLEVEGRVPHVVLVGKGITFDSGGLSLKTAGGMMTMKTDMGGAAAVLAALSACPDLGVRVRVTAITPVTENMPGGRAQKPGDVLTVRDGQTIEVLNTDAEGRLVLADALVLAAELDPDAIIDLATLTGACVVALGNLVAGLFGTDEALVDRVRLASEGAGERTWRLPLLPEYAAHIKSEVADMKNIGKEGEAGAISAALLLSRFVGEVPWVHLDIAGPARADEETGVLAKGGTGFGVRTLLELLGSYGIS